jgi:hypothetical protein
MIHQPSLERSADSLAALFTPSTGGIAAKTHGELRLDLLRWVIALPPEVDPAHAAQLLIGRQSRGESAPLSDFVQAMIVEMGRSDRGRLAAFPKRRRRHAARMEPNESLPRQALPIALD